MADPKKQPPSTSDAAFELHRELRDAREQSAASREILAALGRAAANPGDVLDTVLEYAGRLCGAQAANLYLLDGDEFRLSRASGEIPEEFRRYLLDHPLARNRSSTVGRAAEEMRTIQIPDVLNDAEYGRHDLQRLGGYRTLLSTPMILQDEVVGVLSMWRTDVDPFDDRECELLEEFAVQGAIVLRQVELMRALESRGAELASKVAQLEALRDVGDAIGSSLDLDEVLNQIVSNAVRLTGTDGGSIMEYDEAADTFHVRTAYGSSRELLERLRAITIYRESTLVGRTALAHRPLEVPDLAQTQLDPHLEILFRDGWRSVLAVPMLRGDKMVGVLVIRRRATGSFAPGVTELLETFASQSALAIVNARLFGELQTKTRELEIAGHHKSEFLASMSHELRTPLNEPTTFSVASALEYSLAMVRERATLHAIAITVQVADGIDTVDADELRFKQVVLNLLSNAVKFTPDGGSVVVRAYREGTALCVTVTDTGIGVPPEDQERIFESFQQGRRGAPKEEGTGLGLTLCRRIVGLFGGRMWLESTPGVGSTFGFSIPGLLERGDDAVTGPDELPAVVLVDDDRVSLDLLSAYLDGSPLRVLRARDGVEALALVRKVNPAAIVLDIRLPRLDGWQVLAELKADTATAAIPVVIASVVDDRSRGLALGADIYLLKPVRRDELIDALRRVGTLAEPASSVELS